MLWIKVTLIVFAIIGAFAAVLGLVVLACYLENRCPMCKSQCKTWGWWGDTQRYCPKCKKDR